MADPNVGIELEWVDRVCLAALYTLRDAPSLTEFFEDRILRVGGALDDDATDTRQELAVAVAAARFDVQPSAIEMIVPLALRIVWTESRRELADDEPSIGSIVTEVIRVLLANYNLVRSETGNQPLIRRVHEIQDVNFRAIRQDGDAVTFAHVVGIEYRTLANSDLESVHG